MYRYFNHVFNNTIVCAKLHAFPAVVELKHNIYLTTTLLFLVTTVTARRLLKLKYDIVNQRHLLHVHNTN